MIEHGILLVVSLENEGAGLVAACMIAIVPGYISRSVAGSYDNEGIAIFCMLLTFYFWIKAVNTGTIMWATMTALAYFYMVSSWGGYVFLINLIPLHVLALILLGRFSSRVYVAYSTLYCIGTVLSMQISFVGFQPVQSSEHMLALGTFGLCQLYAFTQYLRAKLSPANFELLFKALLTTLLATLGTGIVVLTITGKISPWTGRFYSLLDPSYAKNHIPIIARYINHGYRYKEGYGPRIGTPMSGAERARRFREHRKAAAADREYLYHWNTYTMDEE
ncbi:Dolichyl-diphosphooligosaccharide--protein glycosyltransferase subunit STT3A [Eumeta japonica]|uniref:Dolichyl-diphosphooligosaccharide--protein glycosyltransferase subunit STT3A n=1 Tax=Eumeta variegata TaxID=151549 RepID=A0A4C1XS17_EUMVA|nr:Dolichyl-diphosphooligosaccharide--protein glycosyltransferase subunit STT3A [Eumeta japonica]